MIVIPIINHQNKRIRIRMEWIILINSSHNQVNVKVIKIVITKVKDKIYYSKGKIKNYKTQIFLDTKSTTNNNDHQWAQIIFVNYSY